LAKKNRDLHKMTIRVDRETLDMANRLCDVFKLSLSNIFRQAVLRLWQNEQPLLKTLNDKEKGEKSNGLEDTTP